MRIPLWFACVFGFVGAGGAGAQQIDYAVLQFPSSASVAPGQSASVVFGDVYAAVVTNANSVPAPGISAQLGIGAHGTDPSTDPGWYWIDAVPNPGYDFSLNNDEYQANVVTHASGTYDYAYRFAYNAGAWVYADLDGTTNGYSSAQAGQLTVTGDTIFVDNFGG